MAIRTQDPARRHFASGLALALGVCSLGVATTGHASTSPKHVISNFSVEIGSDLGYNNYPTPGTSGGQQCRGTFEILTTEAVSITSVKVNGVSFPKPSAVVVHRPGISGSPKVPSGVGGDWSVITHEHDGYYVPTGTWTVILPKISEQTCSEAYDGKVTVWIPALGA